eukprot:scaffold845_cov274-Chaetoceros_neogracile.AAC.42
MRGDERWRIQTDVQHETAVYLRFVRAVISSLVSSQQKVKKTRNNNNTGGQEDTEQPINKPGKEERSLAGDKD